MNTFICKTPDVMSTHIFGYLEDIGLPISDFLMIIEPQYGYKFLDNSNKSSRYDFETFFLPHNSWMKGQGTIRPLFGTHFSEKSK